MLAQLGVTVAGERQSAAEKTSPRSPCMPSCRRSSSRDKTIDITVNSIAKREELARRLAAGDAFCTVWTARSTPIAQGNLIVSGFRRGRHRRLEAHGQTYRAPAGFRTARPSKRAVPSQITQGDTITLNLNTPDFTTATRLVERRQTGAWARVQPPSSDGGFRPGACSARRHAENRVFYRWWRILQLDPRQRRGPRDHQFAQRAPWSSASNVTVSPAAVVPWLVGPSPSRKSRASVSRQPFARVGETKVVTNSTIKVDQGSKPHVPVQARGSNWKQIVRAVNEVGGGAR